MGRAAKTTTKPSKLRKPVLLEPKTAAKAIKPSSESTRVVSLTKSQQKKFKKTTKKDQKKEKGKQYRFPAKKFRSVFISNIPRAFTEPAMKLYFSQFGDMEDLVVARSTKTGGLKGYAIAVYRDADVANIVAKTMHNFLVSGRLMKCYLTGFNNTKKILNEQKEITAENFPLRTSRIKHLENVNTDKEESKDLISRYDIKLKKLKELGVNLNFPDFESNKEKVFGNKVKSTKTPINQANGDVVIEKTTKKKRISKKVKTGKKISDESVKPQESLAKGDTKAETKKENIKINVKKNKLNKSSIKRKFCEEDVSKQVTENEETTQDVKNKAIGKKLKSIKRKLSEVESDGEDEITPEKTGDVKDLENLVLKNLRSLRQTAKVKKGLVGKKRKI